MNDCPSPRRERETPRRGTGSSALSATALRVCFELLRNEQTALDVVQETFIKRHALSRFLREDGSSARGFSALRIRNVSNTGASRNAPTDRLKISSNCPPMIRADDLLIRAEDQENS